MALFNDLSLGFGSKLPMILQAEATECGLACLAMVSGFHGYRADLMSLRRRFPVSLKGATLAGLIQVAGCLNLGARPLKLDLEHLDKLKLPCLLHWNFNHFVVLKEVRGTSVVIHDPAHGVRSLPWSAVSESFTGVALELWPAAAFAPEEHRQTIKLRNLMGRVTGLASSFGQILALALALEVVALLMPFYLQWVIDNVIVSADRDLLTTLAIGFGLLMLVQQVITAIRSWVILYMGTIVDPHFETVTTG